MKHPKTKVISSNKYPVIKNLVFDKWTTVTCTNCTLSAGFHEISSDIFSCDGEILKPSNNASIVLSSPNSDIYKSFDAWNIKTSLAQTTFDNNNILQQKTFYNNNYEVSEVLKGLHAQLVRAIICLILSIVTFQFMNSLETCEFILYLSSMHKPLRKLQKDFAELFQDEFFFGNLSKISSCLFCLPSSSNAIPNHDKYLVHDIYNFIHYNTEEQLTLFNQIKEITLLAIYIIFVDVSIGFLQIFLMSLFKKDQIYSDYNSYASSLNKTKDFTNNTNPTACRQSSCGAGFPQYPLHRNYNFENKFNMTSFYLRDAKGTCVQMF
ncbi:hypothetical protein HELRODRAFT_163002 [Helobdella robusta]|uniref:Uncharacterized protein n=1 Tax=Helobdella robusta TaxID=6412 RepID=T1ETJ4_HELRO|nr:hypothetical protein HELRODRAFT_163002 [Helobdella robusta]ESN99453.1 hypothetical protein HELRODRAFT_163002 [Helobdella robusta]